MSRGYHGGRRSLTGCSLRKYLQAEWWGGCLTGGCFLRRRPWRPGCVSVWWMCQGGAAGGGYPPDGLIVGWLGHRKPLGWWTQCCCGPFGVLADCPGLWMCPCWFFLLYYRTSSGPVTKGLRSWRCFLKQCWLKTIMLTHNSTVQFFTESHNDSCFSV